MKKTTSIFITTNFVGFHQWPDAPDIVAFLRTLHRHTFGVRVEVEVKHDDREIEFFILQNGVNQFISKTLMPMLRKCPHMSCEMMANEIFNALNSTEDYSGLVLSVEVNEDSENGAIVKQATLDKDAIIDLVVSEVAAQNPN